MAHPKDPLQAVQAWERVVAEVPEARLVMCGGGPLSERVRARVAGSPACHAIDHRGQVPDLAEVLAESSIFLLTSKVEGGSTMATLEAMAAGLVPVISDVGDSSLYLHADCGAVVARNAPRAVASAVVRLLRDPEELAAMGERAAAFARSWTVDQMATATERFFDRVLHHHGIARRE
jgi:phosphatidylinositol alpha-1,6-mannosyltransferase